MIDQHDQVIILLSVYNGERYLKHQIDSILAQNYRNILVIARDDASSDRSERIIKSYQERYPKKFSILEDESGNIGAAGSFSGLLSHALQQKPASGDGNTYIAFCDQDDVWKENKLTRLLQAAKELEAMQPGGAILVHSDLVVVDENLHMINPSFTVSQLLDPDKFRLRQMLVRNVVTGCACLFNRALAEMAAPIPRSAMMHDWWLALVASAFGRIAFIDEALVLYRQHAMNTLGAINIEKKTLLTKLLEYRANRGGELYPQLSNQAQTFLNRFHDRLTGKQRRQTRTVIRLYRHGWLQQLLLYKLMRLYD